MAQKSTILSTMHELASYPDGISINGVISVGQCNATPSSLGKLGLFFYFVYLFNNIIDVSIDRSKAKVIIRLR